MDAIHVSGLPFAKLTKWQKNFQSDFQRWWFDCWCITKMFSYLLQSAYEEIVLKNVHRIFPTQRSVYAPDGVKKIKLPHWNEIKQWLQVEEGVLCECTPHTWRLMFR